MDRIAQQILRFRFAIWAVVLGGSAILWWTTEPVSFDQSIEGFFPDDHPALESYQRARAMFGRDDIVFLAYEDAALWTPAGMERIRELAKSISEEVPGVTQVDSLDQMPLPWRVDAAAEAMAAGSFDVARLLGGLTTVSTAIRTAADRPESIAQLRRRITDHPLFREMLVDPAGKTTALVAELRNPEQIDMKEIVRELREKADAFAAKHRHEGIAHVAVVGPPVLIADGFISLDKDNRRLGLVAMALMAATMLVAVRSPWWAVLPLVSGWTTWLITQAFLSYSDLRLTLSAGPIIAQTVVLCMPAASHLAMRFRAALADEMDPARAAHQTLVAVWVPVAWCSVTAAAGYLATMSSSVQPVFQFGATMAVCNLIAGVLAYLLSAGAMQPPAWLARRPVRRTGIAARVTGLTRRVLDRPLMTLIVFAGPCLAMATGITWLTFESNYINIYKQSSRVVRDYHFVEERMGGIGLVEVVFPAPRQLSEITPEWLDQLHETTEVLIASDSKVVSKVLSLADVLRETEKTADEPATEPNPSEVKTERARLRPSLLQGLLGQRGTTSPPTRQQVLQSKLSVLARPAFARFLNNFWYRPADESEPAQMRLLVRIREAAAAEEKEQAFVAVAERARERLGPETFLTGLSHLMTQVTSAVITTQFHTASWAAGIILLMLVLSLRSLSLGVLALVPTLLAVGMVLGVMGWLEIKLDMSTALVASVAMGLSVDDTFHCLLGWQRYRRVGLSARDAVNASYAGSGPGVVLSSSAVSLGFLALLFSEFIPTANFGYLVAVATLGGSLGNLVVLPACLALFYGEGTKPPGPAPSV